MEVEAIPNCRYINSDCMDRLGNALVFFYIITLGALLSVIRIRGWYGY